jgi:uncharacterized membrane protein YdbT with pleckstrin-like domain
MNSDIVIHRSWRSLLGRILLFLLLCTAAIYLSSYFPGSIITGSLFDWGSHTITLSLPLWWLLPFLSLTDMLVRIYDDRYVISHRGIEATIGILSLHQRKCFIRYEDVRSVETYQTLMARILNIGDVGISTAASGAVEVVLAGVGTPGEIKDMVNRERDRRQQLAEMPPDDFSQSTEERLTA